MSEIIDLEDMDYDSIYTQESDQYTGLPTMDSMSDGYVVLCPTNTVVSYAFRLANVDFFLLIPGNQGNSRG